MSIEGFVAGLVTFLLYYRTKPYLVAFYSLSSSSICLFAFVCIHACVPQHKYGGQSALSRFSPTCGFQPSNTGCQPWQQASLPCFSAQPFLFSCLYCFKLGLTIYLKLGSNVTIPLPQPPECWDYRSTLQYLILFY